MEDTSVTRRYAVPLEVDGRTIAAGEDVTLPPKRAERAERRHGLWEGDGKAPDATQAKKPKANKA